MTSTNVSSFTVKPQAQDLLPGTQVVSGEVWHCAIHGTRSKCAFRFMRCDVAPSARDASGFSGAGWLASVTENKATANRK